MTEATQEDIENATCKKHKELRRYTPHGVLCASCYNEALLKLEDEGLTHSDDGEVEEEEQEQG